MSYEQKVTLGEGHTPLTKAHIKGFKKLYIKHEELNPTGSFKDRESVVVINKLLKEGVKKIKIASSGNAAISTAAYAQRAGIKCTCYIPKDTPIEKKNLISLFTKSIVTIAGDYEDVYRYVFDLDDDAVNVTPGAYPYRIVGNKEIAKEIALDLGIPDIIVVPCGNGGNLAGIYEGFKEVYGTPQMVGVQIKGAAPIEVALREKIPYVCLTNVINSRAEGIIARESYCSPLTVEAIKKSNGFMITVTDAEIELALRMVTKTESLVSEFTSGSAFAALPHLPFNKTIVVINTGSGMKEIRELTALVAEGI